MKKAKKWVALALATFITTSSLASTAYASETLHKVKIGDSLWKISSIYKVSMNDIVTWNGLKTTTVYIGQTLKVSKPQPSTGGQPTPTPTSQGATTTYKVKTGDNLTWIARDYKITVAQLKTMNNLKTDLIRVGQILTVPGTLPVTAPPSPSKPVTPTVPTPTTPAPTTSTPPPVAPVTVATIHRVASGESLSLLAIKYKTTVSQIKTWNNLSKDVIYIGQELKVSDGVIPPPTAPAFLSNGVFPLAKNTYSPFPNSWGNERNYGGSRTHEGIDIMAPTGTPIYSATDGKVYNKGWLTLGGWRTTIQTNEGYFLYYAHLSRYEPNLVVGATVKKGQLIGYVGDSGYGKEGTTGMFAPHLHFGLYNSNMSALNPYDHLKYWQATNPL